MNDDIDVLIRVATDAADASRGMDDVGRASRDMADDVERASKEASRSLDGVGDAVDGTASNASTLAGAFGDVAGGLGLIGLGGFSDELESLAPALMLTAGAADIASVAMNTLSLSKIKDTAATIKNKAASIASATASKAQAAAQWALNAAMSANPILLVVLAVAALVAGIVIAYKRSERFRAIVQAVGRAGAQAIGWIVDKVGVLVGWVRDRLPPAWEVMRKAAVTAFRLATAPVRVAIDLFRDVRDWVRDKIPAAAETFKSGFASAFRVILGPVRAVKNALDDVLRLLGKVDTKGTLTLGGLQNLSSGAADGRRGRVAGAQGIAAPTTSITIPITVQGAVDPVATARQLRSILTGQLRRNGITVTPA